MENEEVELNKQIWLENNKEVEAEFKDTADIEEETDSDSSSSSSTESSSTTTYHPSAAILFTTISFSFF